MARGKYPGRWRKWRTGPCRKGYADGRYPDGVAFDASLSEDLAHPEDNTRERLLGVLRDSRAGG